MAPSLQTGMKNTCIWGGGKVGGEEERGREREKKIKRKIRGTEILRKKLPL